MTEHSSLIKTPRQLITVVLLAFAIPIAVAVLVSQLATSREKGVDADILKRMIDRACEFMPRLARLSAVRVWTGFRAATPDKLPLIGPCPNHENLYLATGHEGLGITTSLGTARLLVDLLLRRPSAIPVAPYLPSRINQEAAHA